MRLPGKEIEQSHSHTVGHGMRMMRRLPGTEKMLCYSLSVCE